MSIEAARLSVVVDADTKGAESGLDRMGGVVGKAGDGLKTAALAGLGFATAIGGASVGAAISLEDAFTPIGTLLGNTSPQFAALSDELKNFITNSPASAEDIGMAAYMTLSAGITDTTAVMDTLTASQQLALAGLGDIGQANDLITSAMNSFSQEGLTADQAARLLFGTIASGKTTTTDLANGFGQIAPLAAGAGVSFNDLLAATAALTSTGQSASVAYSGIRGALTAVIKPTAEAAEAAKNLGLDFSQAHLAAVGLPAFLDEVKVATGGNVDTMGQLFGGVEGLNTVMSLTGPQAAAFAANLTGVGKAGANLADRAKEVSNTTSNSFAEMKNKAVVALSALGDHIIDFAMPKIEQIVDWVTENWPEISATIEETVKDIVSAWDSYGVPVMDAIIEVAGNVVAWVKDHWTEISATISSVMKTVRDVISTVLDVVKTLWENYGSTIIGVVRSAFDHIWAVISGVMDAVRGVIDLVMGLIHGDWSRVWDGIKEIVGGVWDAIVALVGFAVDAVKAALEAAWITIKSVADTAWQGIKTGISNAIDAVVGFVKELPARALLALDALPGMLKTAGTNAINLLWSGMSWAWSTGWSFITDIPGMIIGGLSGLGNSLKSIGSQAIHAMWEGIKDAWNWLADKTTFQLPSLHIPGTNSNIGGGTFNLLPHLAGGGILDRPTTFVGGEYAGASTNPEIVAPQSMIRNIIAEELAAAGGSGAGSGVHVEQNFYGITNEAEQQRHASYELAWVMKTMAA